MKNPVALLLAFVTLAASGRLSAQPSTETSAINGAVVSTGNMSLVIDADDGTKRTFLIDTTTTLPLTRLAAGQRVSVMYRTLDADRAQALSVNLLSPDTASTAPANAPAGTTSPEQSSGPVDTRAPVSLVGVAALAIAVAGLFAWVFGRRRHQETAHLFL
jgi:hypothetical protein